MRPNKKRVQSVSTISARESSVQNWPSIIFQEPSVLPEIPKNILLTNSCDTNRSKDSTKQTENNVDKPSVFLEPQKPIFQMPKKKDLQNNEELHLKDFEVNLLRIEASDLTFSSKILGSASQGIVRQASWAGTVVAVKTFPKSKINKLLVREIVLMQKIRHENCISVMAIRPQLREFHIVMQCFNGFDLKNIIFEEPKIILNADTKNNICLQICKGINFIYRLRGPIIHRDIKPSNVMVDQHGNVKICDLGLSNCKNLNSRLQSTAVNTIRGSIAYLSPEIVLHRAEATEKSDVWAVAITLVELYSYRYAFNIPEEEGFDIFGFMKSLFFKNTNPGLDSVPYFCRKSFENCSNYDPDKRTNMQKLLGNFQKIVLP